MKSRKYAICFTLLVVGMALSSPIQPQTKNDIPAEAICSECNLRNKEGKKVGFWIEDDGYRIRENYYKDGVIHGIFRIYDRVHGRTFLGVFGEYKDGNPVGTWYNFGEYGNLVFTEREIRKEKVEYNGRLVPVFKSYAVFYYPSGIIKEEGTAQYDQSIWMNFLKRETWKYYDRSGKLIETKDHK